MVNHALDGQLAVDTAPAGTILRTWPPSKNVSRCYADLHPQHAIAQAGEPGSSLGEGEEARILAVLADRSEDRTFFCTALESAMRMRERYTLDLSQIDLSQRTIYLDRSKNGDQRQVSHLARDRGFARAVANAASRDLGA